MAQASITTAESKLPWPDDPPMLLPRDLIRWGDRTDARDLFWWLHATFCVNEVPAYRCEAIASRVLAEVLTERYGASVTDVWGFVSYCAAKRTSRAWLAACWNEMLHRLVYDIPKALRRDPGWAINEN